MTDTSSTPDEPHHSPATWYSCSGFQRDLLVGIATYSRLEQSPYGANLHGWLDARYPTAVNQSRVYLNLGDLVEAGLLRREPITDRKTAYELTDTAQQALATHAAVIDALDLPTRA